MTTIACPAQMIFAVLREPSKRRRYDSAADIPGLQGLDPAEAERLALELIDLSLIARDHLPPDRAVFPATLLNKDFVQWIQLHHIYAGNLQSLCPRGSPTMPSLRSIAGN